MNIIVNELRQRRAKYHTTSKNMKQPILF